MLVNPKRKRVTRKARANPKRRRRTRRKATRRRRRNPVAANPRRRTYRRRRTRRNPKLSIKSVQRDAIVPAAIGGFGALGVDIAYAMLPLPAQFKTGMIGSVAKLGAAVLAGHFVGKMTNRKTGDAFTVGAVTIQAYGLIKGLVQQSMPNLPLSGDPSLAFFQPGMGYMNAGMTVDTPYSNEIPHSNVGEYISGMGEFISGGGSTDW